MFSKPEQLTEDGFVKPIAVFRIQEIGRNAVCVGRVNGP